MAYGKQLSATNQVKVGAGKLFGFVFSSTSSGTIAVYDSMDGDTVNDPLIINTITPTAGTVLSFPVGIQFNNGLYLVVANTLQFTVVFE